MFRFTAVTYFYHRKNPFFVFNTVFCLKVHFVNTVLATGIPGDSSGKAPANAGDTASDPGSGRSTGIGNGNPLQYSCLGNLTDRGDWQATVHGSTESDTLSDWAHTQYCWFSSYMASVCVVCIYIYIFFFSFIIYFQTFHVFESKVYVVCGT